jgi:hypothetical protein
MKRTLATLVLALLFTTRAAAQADAPAAADVPAVVPEAVEVTTPSVETPAAATEVPATPAPVVVDDRVVHVVSDARGLRLRRGSEDFFVVGVNWDHVPVGQNYAWSLWEQPDDVIVEALSREMPLLQRMHVNALRIYSGIPARWIEYIYDRYGIWTVLNHTVGRYGFNIDGRWVPSVDYSDAHTRDVIAADVAALVASTKNTRGLLFWMLGNENNYGLSWSSTEIEALPVGERDTARARHLYSLFGRIIGEVKTADHTRPVAIANGDLQYLELIAAECKGLDIFGTNVYRGRSFRDVFTRVQQTLGVPVVFTEFGADAYNAREQREDDVTQANYLLAQWREMYANAAGNGGAGNASGGFIFQWSDGWWKYRQTENLEVHDTTASWPNDAYPEDFVRGQNNMNEEWWGICAKGLTDSRGLYQLRPRAAYYVLKDALATSPYALGSTTTVATVATPTSTTAPVAVVNAADLSMFDRVDVQAAAALAHGEAGFQSILDAERYRVSTLRLEMSAFTTGGTSRVREDVPGNGDGFDHTQSVYVGFTANPHPTVMAEAVFNVVGNVATNPINELFYETHARTKVLTDGATGNTFLFSDRLRLYGAQLTWDNDWFSLKGFFRRGHLGWQYEGDFFGLYRDAYYGDATDIYNADGTPNGVELAGKGLLSGLKVAAGTELWWGANPAVVAKYNQAIGPVMATLMYTEQAPRPTTVVLSSTIPELPTRKLALSGATTFGGFGLEVGGIWSGSGRLGQSFTNVKDDGTVRQDEVLLSDTGGVKAKLTFEFGNVHAYAQGAYMGLVAEAGPTQAITYTGWLLKDSGSGNQTNALAGVVVDVGLFQIAPNFLWQRPIVGPIPSGLPDAPPRSILTDPFAVRGNRETIAGELLLTFDPTPGTWLWAWDNDLREDAIFAGSIDFSYRHQPTTQDAGLGVTADGVLFAFDGAPPPKDLYAVDARAISRLTGDVRVVGHGYVALGESTGNSDRFINRYGADARLVWGSVSSAVFAKFNDWGPYTYHRDFNITYPLQLIGDVSTTLGNVRWFDLVQTRLGVRGTYRALNGFSARFCPDASALTSSGACDALSGPADWGSEYEVKTYLTVGL